MKHETQTLNDLTDITISSVSQYNILQYNGTNFINTKEVQNLSLISVNTTANSTNKLSVKSDSVLFDSATDDSRVKVNKATSSNTASHLFQSNYSGRAEADITGWIKFFVFSMLNSIKKVKEHIKKQLDNNTNNYNNEILKSLTPQERLVLTLFENTNIITSNDIARLFNFTQRSARNLANKLVSKNFLKIGDVSNKNRNFKLNRNFIENKE